MNTKTKVTFVLQEHLQRDLRGQITKDGYDMRGKSRWLSEAIQSLLRMKNYIELVHLGNEMKGFEKADSIVITRELKKLLDDSVINIRKEYPALEGVQSLIIRTAIVQRLLHS